MKPSELKLFECMQPRPDTVVRIGPNPAARAARPERANPWGPPPDTLR
jgi:hypothetical protein